MIHQNLGNTSFIKSR